MTARVSSRVRPEYCAVHGDEAACDLHSRLESLVAKADKLQNLCDRRGREPSPGEKRRMRALSAEIARALAWAVDSAARLIAPAAPGD